EVVHVGARTVVADEDRVPRAVDEAVAVTRAADHIARGVVDLEARDRRMREARADQLPGGVPAARYRRPDLLLLVGRGRGADPAPGDVGVDAAERLFLRPEVDEQEVAGADRGRMVRAGLVVRVGRVSVDADDRIRLGPEADLLERLDDEALDLVLVRRLAAAEDL